MKLSTMTDLVTELEKVPKTPLVEKIIEEAKAGEFHDYKNRKYACGKIAASALLREANLIALAKRIENGDFDEEADAEDVVYLQSICPPGLEKALGLEAGAETKH